jgi:hypothetical protein
MTNPLLEKFEEIYGEKKEEVVEEKKLEIPEDYGASKYFTPITGGMADDVITMGGNSITLNPPPPPPPPVFTISGGSEITTGDYVIPIGTVNNGAMSMDGSYVSPSTLINSKPINRAPTCFAFDPPKTEMEKHFLKVLEDVANKKAFVSTIRADIDPSFTGFGGRIRYSIEIVGNYP